MRGADGVRVDASGLGAVDDARYRCAGRRRPGVRRTPDSIIPGHRRASSLSRGFDPRRSARDFYGGEGLPLAPRKAAASATVFLSATPSVSLRSTPNLKKARGTFAAGLCKYAFKLYYFFSSFVPFAAELRVLRGNSSSWAYSRGANAANTWASPGDAPSAQSSAYSRKARAAKTFASPRMLSRMANSFGVCATSAIFAQMTHG